MVHFGLKYTGSCSKRHWWVLCLIFLVHFMNILYIVYVIKRMFYFIVHQCRKMRVCIMLFWRYEIFYKKNYNIFISMKLNLYSIRSFYMWKDFLFIFYMYKHITFSTTIFLTYTIAHSLAYLPYQIFIDVDTVLYIQNKIKTWCIMRVRCHRTLELFQLYYLLFNCHWAYFSRIPYIGAYVFIYIPNVNVMRRV